ncbi:hypothetical protein K7472_13435 [Streptomyces sp. PTM05]|uniref:Uncharacterized protein n=1 Tax=Streptantibioticus parmotrematis TaxID=2873249 RepID=A0ABS7QRM9_9ACTN|nr:hypothetical protein [Streptantibioticus parmotrematis]MBY8885849.1 hypothetical protein [Streptantibioticus parmotrematis]
MDIELLMERLGKSGVTMILKVDHERMQAEENPWTLVMSGPGLGESSLIRTDASSLKDCLDYGLRELRSHPGEWDWVDQYN